VTPDGRYFVVRGRLWRIANSGLDEASEPTSLDAHRNHVKDITAEVKDLDAIEKNAQAESARGKKRSSG
jgi:hypothetical protein